MEPELGYRLHSFAWNQGFATEGSRALIDRGFAELGVERVTAGAMAVNIASRRVMEKLRMVHDPSDDFEHPRLEQGHPLSQHVLYRLSKTNWQQTGDGCRFPGERS